MKMRDGVINFLLEFSAIFKNFLEFSKIKKKHCVAKIFIEFKMEAKSKLIFLIFFSLLTIIGVIL
jgi:hypothetical protein